MSETSQFSRAAIMEWANGILSTNYANFAEVPAKDLALLLYGVYDASTQTQKVSLHDIQFTNNLTPTILLHNAQHVLQLIKTLSETEAKEQLEGGKESTVPSMALYKMDPNLSAADWLEGKAFVEELKMWRWLRMKAELFGVGPDAVRAAINAYLHGSTSTPPPPSRAVLDEQRAAPEYSVSGSACESRGDARKRARDAPNGMERDATEGSLSPNKQTRKEASVSVSSTCNADQSPREEVAARTAKDGRESKASDEVIREFEHENTTEEAKSKQLYQKVVHTKMLLQELETQIAQSGTSDDYNESSAVENVNPLLNSLCTDLSFQQCQTNSHQCKQCPTVFAHMVQSSLDLIKVLEEQRKAALNACVKKDTVALITALQNIV